MKSKTPTLLMLLLLLTVATAVGVSQAPPKLIPATDTIRRAEGSLTKTIQTEDPTFTAFARNLYQQCLLNKLWEPIPPGLPNRWFSITGQEATAQQVERTIDRRVAAVRVRLAKNFEETSSLQGRRYLELLSNRVSCTLLHLASFRKMAELQPLFKGKDPEAFGPKDRRRVRDVSDEALRLQHEYMRLHARMIEDRGAEGTLMSYYYSAPWLANQIRAAYGDKGGTTAPRAKAADAPPAPAEKKKEAGLPTRRREGLRSLPLKLGGSRAWMGRPRAAQPPADYWKSRFANSLR
jgi:hypothetical protein